MSNEADRWKVVADLEVESTIPRERIIAAVKRAKGHGKPSSKDAGPQQYRKAGKRLATQSGPREYKKG
jgi:hypothetical protein